MAAPGPHAAHVASAAAEASPTVDASHIDARRMAAIAEGNRATREHSHVNELIEEEFNRVPSKSVHHTAHEYLKVIEVVPRPCPRSKPRRRNSRGLPVSPAAFQGEPAWLLLTLGFTLFIWGNSLVPGEGSGSLSLA